MAEQLVASGDVEGDADKTIMMQISCNLKSDREALRDFAQADIEIQEFFGANRVESDDQ